MGRSVDLPIPLQGFVNDLLPGSSIRATAELWRSGRVGLKGAQVVHQGLEGGAEVGVLELGDIRGLGGHLEGGHVGVGQHDGEIGGAAELGAGLDIYNQWFKMGIEVKMSYGLLDIVKDEAFIYTAPIEKLRNKLFQVSFLFE